MNDDIQNVTEKEIKIEDKGKDLLTVLKENKSSEKKPFEATLEEYVLAMMTFLAGFCYIKSITGVWVFTVNYYLLAVAGILIFIVEDLNRNRKRTPESMIIMVCFLISSIALSIYRNIERKPLFPSPYQYYRVWDEGQLFLFVHTSFIWYMMSRSGKLLEGMTGHLLPADVLNATVTIPLKNLFLRSRTIVWGTNTVRGSKKPAEFTPWSIIAVAVSVMLLVSATSLLMQADESFEMILYNITERLSFTFNDELFAQIIFSIPVGAWMWALIGGSFRYPEENLTKKKASIMNFLETLAKISANIWTFVIAAFSAVYLLFFIVQANYLFSGFFGKLPDGFIVSEYARNGFFELCKVMAINFALLWMVTRTSTKETRDSKLFRYSCLLLLCESILLSAVSISKLALYISSFGITPLRVQSSWFAAVLLAGCVLWIYNILTGKGTFRYWMYFGAITLSILAVL